MLVYRCVSTILKFFNPGLHSLKLTANLPLKKKAGPFGSPKEKFIDSNRWNFKGKKTAQRHRPWNSSRNLGYPWDGGPLINPIYIYIYSGYLLGSPFKLTWNLKMDSWKTILSFWGVSTPIFRGLKLAGFVSGNWINYRICFLVSGRCYKLERSWAGMFWAPQKQLTWLFNNGILISWFMT